jgi:hypothetical protein
MVNTGHPKPGDGDLSLVQETDDRARDLFLLHHLGHRVMIHP